MKTKRQLQNEGWIFTTCGGGAISATNLKKDINLKALNMLSLRKKIAKHEN